MPVKPRRASRASAAAKTAERPAQRRRTRKAIVDAAMALVARGKTPSVADVAAAADVSRRTVYLYFPTFDQLLIDATVGALTQTSVDRAIGDDASDGANAGDRVERMVRALHHVTPEVERLGRTLIKLTVENGAPADDMPRRGYRRVEWIESALAPLRAKIDAARWRRLVSALAMVVGWEALIVQRDVCGMSTEDGVELSLWTARTLVEATLREAAARHRSARSRTSRRAS
jgi:AcrR family transcriptional regulator